MSEWGSANQSAGEPEVYRAIGRYVVAFSYLIYEMREAIVWKLGTEDGDPTFAQLAMGETFASQITNAFFAVCQHSTDLDDEETQVAVRLKKEVSDAIKVRNDIAHGDWHINLWGRPEPHMTRIKPGRRAGAAVEKARPIEELEPLSEALEDLAETIIEFAHLCFGIHPNANDGIDGEIRVRDVYRFQKTKGVMRIGRYAA